MVHGGAVWWIEVCGRIYMLSYFPPILAKHDRSHYGRSPMCTYHRLSAITHCTDIAHYTLHIARTAHSTTTLSALTRFLKKGGFLRRFFFCSKTNCKWTTYSFRTCCHSICHHLSLFVQLPDLWDVQMASPPPTLACPYTGIFPHQCHKCLHNCLVSVKPGPKTE